MSAKQVSRVLLAVLMLSGLVTTEQVTAAPVVDAANLGAALAPHDVVAFFEKCGFVWWIAVNIVAVAVHVYRHGVRRPSPRCALIAAVWGSVALFAIAWSCAWLMILAVLILVATHICEATAIALSHMRS